MRKKRLFSALLAVIMIVSVLIPAVPAQADALTDATTYKNWPLPPSIESKSAILIDAKNGNILYQKKANKACYPASITKVMTALIVLEHCELDDEVTFSYRATHELEPGSTTIARTEGEVMTVRDCLHALLLQSANEVAQGLAEHVAGSIEAFADMMNEKAVELGCTKTHFNNPSGLNSTEHYTTCHDMALILQAASKNPDFLEIESHISYTIPATNKHEEETPIAQKHALVKNGPDHYEGAVAGKTGYTTIAGHTLVTYAVRGNMELVCVIMRSEGTHYADTRTLLNYGFDLFNMKDLSQTDARDIVRQAWDAEAVDEATAETEIDVNAGAAGIADLTGGSQKSHPPIHKLTDAQWERTVWSEDSWILLPETLDFASLDTEVEILGEAVEEGENQPLAVIRYLNKGDYLGSGTLILPYFPEPETETEEEETEAAVAPEPKKTFKDTLIMIGSHVNDLLNYVRDLVKSTYTKLGIRLWLGIAILLSLVVAILVIRNSIHRKKKTYYGPHFTSRPRRRYGRDKNKYHWKK